MQLLRGWELGPGEGVSEGSRGVDRDGGRLAGRIGEGGGGRRRNEIICSYIRLHNKLHG